MALRSRVLTSMAAALMTLAASRGVAVRCAAPPLYMRVWGCTALTAVDCVDPR
jgi:hypothetical protein